MPGVAALYAFHALFYAVFIPRWLLRWRKASAARAGSSAATPPAAAATRTARASRLPLVLHGLAMGVLYFGLGAAAQAHLAPVAAAAPGKPGTDALAGADFLLPPQRAVGGLSMLGAVALAAWALSVFRSWRLLARIEPGHELCTAGPFRWVRHPIYLAMDLLAVGSWLWAPTATVALGAALVALAGDLRARSEERVLLATFGETYRRYCRRARRFLPGVY